VLHKHGLLLDEPNPLLTHRLSAAVTGSFVLPADAGVRRRGPGDALGADRAAGRSSRRNHPILGGRSGDRRLYEDWLSNYARSCHDAW